MIGILFCLGAVLLGEILCSLGFRFACRAGSLVSLGLFGGSGSVGNQICLVRLHNLGVLHNLS